MRPVKMIPKSDPLVQLHMPAKLADLLKTKAKKNRRSLQDEANRRLAATLDLVNVQSQALHEIQDQILLHIKSLYP